MKPPGHNRHPADELAEVRHAIRELEAEEARLREWLLEHQDDRIGDTWGVRVEGFTHRRLDLDAALMRLGRDLLAPFVVEKSVPVVRLVKRVQEETTDAIIPI